MSAEPIASDRIGDSLQMFVERLVAEGGPARSDFQRLDKLFQHGEGAFIEEVTPLLEPAFKLSSLQGFVARHPYGYHGDFSVIEKIYARKVSACPRVRNWDVFFQSQPACQAVRNRREFLMSWLECHLFDPPVSVPLEVLSVASGPCREIIDFLERHADETVRFTCLDRDANAIAFSSALLYPWRDRVSFLEQSAFDPIAGAPFDLIYSAGLFDYLSDRLAVGLIRRLWKILRPGGRLLVGNFSPANPSRAYMEFGGWNLIHRTEEALIELLRRGTGGHKNIDCSCEPLGINLFVEAVKD